MTKKIIFVILFFFINLNLFAGKEKMLINADELLKELNSKNIVIIDARNSVNFIKGHIKSAVHLDGGCSGKICEKRGDLPCVLKPVNKIVKILKDKGICPDKRIIIYGDEDSWGAEGRIFWILDKLGYKNILILNGGYNYWKNRGFPVSYGFFIFLKQNRCKNFKYKKFKLLNANDIHKLIQNNQAIIIDTRTLKEYKGAILYGERRGGHIPGSVHIHWKEFLNKNYTLKTKIEILKILTTHNTPSPENCHKKIITICTGGVRSGFVYFVLKYVGYRDVENYDNGFWEWALSKYAVEK